MIDFSEAVLQGVAADLKVNDGTITSIKTAAYGSASAAIARVVIGFERELDTDISTDGNVLKKTRPRNSAAVHARRYFTSGVVSRRASFFQRPAASYWYTSAKGSA